MMVRTAITTLLFRSSPHYVAFLIVFLIFNTLKAMIRARAVANFGQKFMERSKTKLNTFTAVPIILGIARICTSTQSTMKGGIFSRVRRSMNEIALGYYFAIQASARLTSPFRQRILRHVLYLSAFTFTRPKNRRALVQFDNQPSSETLTCQIFERGDTLTNFATIASARLGFACQHPRFGYCSCHAAITQAMPHRVSTIHSRKTQNKQSAKSLCGQISDAIFSNRLGIYSKIIGSQDVFSFIENIKVRVVGSDNFFRPAFIIAQ